MGNKVDFLLIELADIDIISTAKKLDANDVFIYSAIIHISASQYCISNAAVTQIELLRVLLCKHNGNFDFLFRLALVERAAVRDAHTQLIQCAVRKRIHGAACFIRDRPQFVADLR